MIQAYSEKNTNFSRNGNVVLIPDEALLSAELNGPWVLNLHHPIDKKERWKHLTENAVLKVSSFNGDQLFRIYNREKSDGGISVQAYPIFFDAGRDCFLTDVRPTGKNGQQALDIICAGTKYSGESNITRATTAYYIRKNLMEAINGDLDQSFTNRWGGEILYDNYKVIINEHVGGDYGTELRYGKNIPSDGIKETIDMSGVVTRIYPKAFNGHALSGSGYVDSPNIDAYPVAMCSELQFEDVKMREDAQEDDEKNGVVICDTQAELDNALIQKCRDQFTTGIDKPKVSISADMILLQDTDQYKDYKVLESVSLGDTIHCKHSKLGIVTDARVIALEYDCIQKRVTSVELGDFKNDYFDRVTSSTGKVESIINPDGTIMAEKVQGILNGIYTQLKLQSTVAQKVKGRAFTVEDLDPDSDLFGCMTWGTQGLQLATRRTADGKDWDWTTAVTARGILADAIIAGILTDKTGKNYWNLDTGEFRLSADAFKVDDQTVEDYINGKIDNATAQIRLLTMQLSNDMCSVATEADGTGGDYSECYTEVMLLIGTTDITDSDKVQYTVNPSAGVDGSWDPTRKRYTVRDMSEDNGSVTITATYAGITVSKVFSVSKAKAGEPGTNGDSVESITEYYAVSSSSTVAPSQWYKTPPQMTEHNRYLWNYETFIYSDGRTEDTPKHVIGVYGATGQDGNGISSITNYYLATSQQSGVTTSTYGWTTTPQTMTEQKKYLWNYEIITYTDKTVYTVAPHIIGTYGDKGEDGRTYILQPDTLVIKQGADNVYTPRSVTFSAFYRDGTTASRTPYSGRFKVEESTDGTYYYTKYTSYYDESSHTHTPTSTDVKSIRCTLYASGGTSTPLDIQSVAVVRDVDNLTQEEVFNILTDNGRLQGIYMKDGKLYINANYIMSGTLAADLIKGGVLKLGGSNNVNGRTEILDSAGSRVGYIDNTGVHFNKGEFSGTLTALVGGEIAGWKIDSSSKSLKSPGSKIILDAKNNRIITAANTTYGTKVIVASEKSYFPVVQINGAFRAGETNGIYVQNAMSSKIYFYDAFSDGSGGSNTDQIYVSGNLRVTGTKNREVKTQYYDRRLQYCYEMASPMFGDIGQGILDDAGVCHIYLDDIFAETVSTKVAYQVFLQKEGEGDLWVESKKADSFVVKGTPGLTFAWEIKVKQKDYEYERLNESVEIMDEIERIEYVKEGQALFSEYCEEKEMTQ